MQVELEELQPKLVIASDENIKMMAVCIRFISFHFKYKVNHP